MRFTGLTPGATYDIIARRAETADGVASSASAPTAVTMLKLRQERPEAPSAVAGTTTILVSGAGVGLEYSVDGAHWQQPDRSGKVLFTNLKDGMEYPVTARRAETPTQYASLASEPTVAATLLKLSGVTIEGNAVFGETLTAVNAPETVGQVSYQWFRDGQLIAGASGPSYKLKKEDIGGSIMVMGAQIVAIEKASVAESKPVGPVEKALGGGAGTPVLAKKTRNSITVRTKPGEAYSIDGGKGWQITGTFGNLRPGMQYRVVARRVETETTRAGESSKALIVTTDKAATPSVSPTPGPTRNPSKPIRSTTASSTTSRSDTGGGTVSGSVNAYTRWASGAIQLVESIHSVYDYIDYSLKKQ